MVLLMPKVKGRGQSIYKKYWRGAIFQRDSHCNPILKAKFTFILVSSFQMSLGKSNINITFRGFFVYVEERKV